MRRDHMVSLFFLPHPPGPQGDIIYIYGVGGVWVQLLGGQRACAYVILVLHESIWNALAITLVLLAFEDTSSLGSPPYQVVSPPV